MDYSDNGLKEPLNPTKVYENIFCIGDACITPSNEEKTVYPLKQCARICADNIIAMASGGLKLKKIPKTFAGVYLISLGPNDGIMIINDMVKTG